MSELLLLPNISVSALILPASVGASSPPTINNALPNDASGVKDMVLAYRFAPF